MRVDWKNIDYVKAYLKKLQSHYRIKDDEWHIVTNRQVRAFNGRGLFNQYKTLNKALQEAFPGIAIKSRGRQNWRDTNYVKEYLNRLQNHYQIKDDEWHLITNRQVIDFRGSGLLRHYKTLENALQSAFSSSAKRDLLARGWGDRSTVRNFLETVKTQLNINDKEWHQVTHKQLLSYKGAKGLLDKHGSFYSAVRYAYPEIQIFSRNKWDFDENVISFLKQLEERLFIEVPQDWYRVSTALVKRFGGGGLLKKRNMFSILQLCYPQFEWDMNLVNLRNKKAEQFFLRNVVKQVFPGAEIVEDNFLPELKFSQSGRPVGVDLYLPEYNLAFEYQGEHHFTENPYFGPMEMYSQRDRDKVIICQEQGLHLIVIPHTWERTIKDLQERIIEVCGHEFVTEDKGY